MDTKLLYSILTFNFNNFRFIKIKLCLSLNRKQFNKQSISIIKEKMYPKNLTGGSCS